MMICATRKCCIECGQSLYIIIYKKMSGQRTFVCMGCGMYTWWSIGALYGYHIGPGDHCVGISGGSIAAVVCVCAVPIELCLEKAPKSVRSIRGLYTILRDWLHAILPIDAHQQCTGRVSIIWRDLYGCIQSTDVYSSREILIDLMITACNLPLHTGFLRIAMRTGVDAVYVPQSWFHPHGIIVDPVHQCEGVRYRNMFTIPSENTVRVQLDAGRTYARSRQEQEYVHTHSCNWQTMSKRGLSIPIVIYGFMSMRLLLRMFNGQRLYANGIMTGIIGLVAAYRSITYQDMTRPPGVRGQVSWFLGYALADLLHPDVLSEKFMVLHHVSTILTSIWFVDQYHLHGVANGVLASELYPACVTLSRLTYMRPFRGILRLCAAMIVLLHRIPMFVRVMSNQQYVPLFRLVGLCLFSTDVYWLPSILRYIR